MLAACLTLALLAFTLLHLNRLGLGRGRIVGSYLWMWIIRYGLQIVAFCRTFRRIWRKPELASSESRSIGLESENDGAGMRAINYQHVRCYQQSDSGELTCSAFFRSLRERALMSWASVAASLLSSLYSCSKSRAASDVVRFLFVQVLKEQTFIAVSSKMQGPAHAKDSFEIGARVSILSALCICI